MPDSRRVAAVLDALDVERNAKVGVGAGVALAVLAYAYRVARLAGPTADTRGSPLLFAMLAFVLAVSAGALVALLLTLRSAVRLAREADDAP